MTQSTPQGLTSEEEAINDPNSVVRAEIYRDQAVRSRFGGPNSEVIIPPSTEGLHEISGMTEGKMKVGDTIVDVAVAVADKNNLPDGYDRRSGADVIAISYEDPQKGLIYETIDIVMGGDLLAGKGFEDMSYKPGENGEEGTYYLVDEGGGKKGNYSAPTIYTAKLETLADGTHVMKVSGEPIAVEVPSLEYSTPWTGDNSDKRANGAEGMAVDDKGNIYLGMQETGNIYKGELKEGKYTWTAEPVIKTGHNDLSAMVYNVDKGSLIVGFGNQSADNGNNIIEYTPPKPDASSTDWTASNPTHVTGIYDLEALNKDGDGTIIAGSDNDSNPNNVVNVVQVNTTLN